MKPIRLIYIYLLALGLCCCNNKNNQECNKISIQDVIIPSEIMTDMGSSVEFINSNDFDEGFTLLYRMKGREKLIGDVYVKFEKNSLFKYLYIINNADTLYSIEDSIFLNKNKVIDYKLEFSRIGLNDFGGYRFSVMKPDCLLLNFCNKNGDEYIDFSPAFIEWNYDNNIIESFIP